MTDLFKHLHAKLGCMVLRLFPKVMQTILKHYIKPPWLKQKYSKKGFRFLLTDKEIIIMDKLPVMDEFTIEICYKILRYEDIVDEPKCKWGNVPHDTEVEIADDIQRLINATNSIIKLNYEEVTEHYAEQVLEEIKLFVTRTDSHLEQDSLGRMYNSLCRSETDFTSILQDLTRVKAIEESLPNTENEKSEMFSRLSIPIVETFQKILRYVIRQKMSAQQMYQKCVPVLHTFSPEQRTIIKGLQFSNTYDSLDFTLIYQLLRQFPLITKPTNGWGKLPDKVDINLGDDVERIRCYRNNLAHRSDTKVDKKEFNEYFEEFCGIGFRMDQNLLQTTNYEKEIFDYRSCGMDTTMQKKYENAMKAIENIKLRFEKRPIKFYWGDDFDTWLTNLRSLLREEKLEGRQKVRLQIIFQNADDVENNIEVLNSLTEEINDGLSGVEFIVATKGSLVLIIDILLEKLETEDELLATLALFLEKILARITTVTSETIDIVLLPVEESTQWIKPNTMGKQVYLELDIEAQLLETDEKMVEQLTKISDAFLKHSNGSGTNQNITATLLPIDLENMSKIEDADADTQTLELCYAQAHIPGKFSLHFEVELKQKFQIKKLEESFILLDCATINNQVIFSKNTAQRLVMHNFDGSFIRDFKLSETPLSIALINENAVVITFNKSHMQILNINTGQVQDVIETSGDSFWVSYENKLLYASIDAKRVDVITLEGEVIRSFDFPLSPIKYIAAATDSLFFTDQLHDALYCCDLYGSVRWKFTNEKMKRPYSVTSDGKGNAYVACSLSNNVVVVSSDGKYQKEIEIQKDDLRDPTGVHYDKAGNNLLVFNRSSGKVLLYEIKHSK